MQITRFKNKAVRLFLFCALSVFITLVFIQYHDSMYVIGITFFTTALMYIFNSSKMIDQAFSKRYRFSFLRLLFLCESLIHSFIQQKFKAFSKEILIFFLMGTLLIISGEVYLMVMVLINLIVAKVIFEKN